MLKRWGDIEWEWDGKERARGEIFGKTEPYDEIDNLFLTDTPIFFMRTGLEWIELEHPPLLFFFSVDKMR